LNPVKVSALVDELYQVLHKVPRIRVIELADAAIIAAPVTPSALGNDILVTIPSALGEGSYSSLTGVSPIGSSTAVLTGAAGRDHAAVADGITAGNVVAPWLITIETIKGDLR